MAKHGGDLKVVAGGTDLLPSMKQKLFTPPYVLDLRAVSELRGIRSVPGKGVEIGTLTTLSVIEHSPVIRRNYAVLHEAVKTVASPVLRNMGTLGGNICLDTRCLWYNQSLLWRQSCGFCLKKGSDLCHVAPGGWLSVMRATGGRKSTAMRVKVGLASKVMVFEANGRSLGCSAEAARDDN